MSESERVALALRGVTTVVLGTLLLYAVYVIVNKYRSRYPTLGIVDWVLTAASKVAILVMVVYVLAAWPFATRIWLPLVAAIGVELLPRRFREGFWDDLSFRAIVIGACCFTISEMLFAWRR